MTYSSVMTHVQPEPEAAPRLACAVDLAQDNVCLLLSH